MRLGNEKGPVKLENGAFRRTRLPTTPTTQSVASATPTAVRDEAPVKRRLKLKLKALKAKKKLKLCPRSASVPNSGGKLKQRPLNVNVLTFGREKCMHRATRSDRVVIGLLVLSCKLLKHSSRL